MAAAKVATGLLLCAAASAAGFETDGAEGLTLMRKEAQRKDAQVKAHVDHKIVDLPSHLRDRPVDRAFLEDLVEHHRLTAGFPKDIPEEKASALLEAHAKLHSNSTASWSWPSWPSWESLPSTSCGCIGECYGYYTARAAALAYRHSYMGLLINPMFLIHKSDVESCGWKSVGQYTVTDFPGSDFAEIWQSGDKCILSFRGSEDLWDFVNDVLVDPEEYMGLPDVSKGVKNEFELMYNKMKESNAFETMRACKDLTVTGHSLGAALAALFAALANRDDDPMQAGLTVHRLYQYGPIPSAATPLKNEKATDGCFEGARYYNCLESLTSGKPYTDFAGWVGSHFANAVPGSMNHAMVKSYGRVHSWSDYVLDNTIETQTCTEAPFKPAIDTTGSITRNDLTIPLHLPELYVRNVYRSD